MKNHRELYKVGDKVLIISAEGQEDEPLWYDEMIGKVFTIKSIDEEDDIIRIAEKNNRDYGIWMNDIVPANSITIEMFKEIK